MFRGVPPQRHGITTNLGAQPGRGDAAGMDARFRLRLVLNCIIFRPNLPWGHATPRDPHLIDRGVGPLRVARVASAWHPSAAATVP